ELSVRAESHALIEVDLVINVALIHAGQQESRPAPSRPEIIIRSEVGVRISVDVAGRKDAVCIVIVVQGDSDLLQVVPALGPASRLASLLHGWQQQRNQYGNNGDDDKQLD